MIWFPVRRFRRCSQLWMTDLTRAFGKFILALVRCFDEINYRMPALSGGEG